MIYDKSINEVSKTPAYDTKEEVMEWMLDIQLGRRNLSPIQRIAVAERYRPIYEKQAKENQGTRNDLKNNITVNLPQSPKKQKRNPTTSTGGSNPQPLPNSVNPENKVER